MIPFVGIAITPTGAGARLLAVDSDHPDDRLRADSSDIYERYTERAVPRRASYA